MTETYAPPRDEIQWRQPRRILTPLRFLLAAGLVAACALLLYALFIDRSGLQIPILVSGFLMLGVILLLMAIASLRRLLRLGRQGSGGGALGAAVFGGLSAVGAAGALAGALIVALLWGSS